MVEAAPTQPRPFVAIVLIVLATQAPYLFFTPGKHDPEIWPFYGLLAGFLALALDRPARLADAGLTSRGLLRGVPWLVLALAAWASGLALGHLLGWVHFSEGVNRSGPDLLRPFLARLALVAAVAILGDELAWRGVLLGDARARFGRWRGLLLIAVLSALYRIPLLVRMGLVDDLSIGIQAGARELLRALALGLLFERTRNLWVTGLYAFAVWGAPMLILGNAEDPFEPLLFYGGAGGRFVALTWLGELLPVVVLLATAPRGAVTASARSTDP